MYKYIATLSSRSFISYYVLSYILLITMTAITSFTSDTRHIDDALKKTIQENFSNFLYLGSTLLVPILFIEVKRHTRPHKKFTTIRKPRPNNTYYQYFKYFLKGMLKAIEKVPFVMLYGFVLMSINHTIAWALSINILDLFYSFFDNKIAPSILLYLLLSILFNQINENIICCRQNRKFPDTDALR